MSGVLRAYRRPMRLLPIAFSPPARGRREAETAHILVDGVEHVLKIANFPIALGLRVVTLVEADVDLRA